MYGTLAGLAFWGLNKTKDDKDRGKTNRPKVTGDDQLHYLIQDNILTIDSKFGPVGVVGAEVIGYHTLVAPLISEVDIEEMKHGGVDQLSLLVLCIVLHFCIIQHLAVLPPCRGHWRITAAGRNATQSDVIPPQCHGRLWVTCDVWFGEIICGGEGAKGSTSIEELVVVQHYVS